MKATLSQLMDSLAIETQMGPYDSHMWSADDDDRGVMCTAQASMNGEGDEMDVTIDVTHTKPKPDTPEHEQTMFFHLKQDNNKKWTPDILRIKRDLMHSKIFDWEKKACDFFVAVVAALKRDTVPDLDEMIERFFKATDNFATGTGGGGKRNPTIKPEQLLNPMKKF